MTKQIDTVIKDFDGKFPKTSKDDFEKQLSHWIGKNQIIAHHFNDMADNVKVIAKCENGKYFMYRMFPLANKWHVSIDVSNSTLDSLLEFMLKN